MIVWLRGTSGAGKSYVGRALVERYGERELWWPAGHWPNKNKRAAKLVGHECRGGLFVVGPYRPSVGGDFLGASVRDQVEFVRRAAAKYPFVFMESLRAAHSNAHAFEPIRSRLVAPYVDASFETCLAGVYERNGGKKINEHERKVMYDRTMRSREWFLAAGIPAPLLPRESSVESTVELLREGGWSE